MKFNNIMNERIEDDAQSFARSNPQAANKMLGQIKGQQTIVDQGTIKIELAGVDNDGRGSTYGDKMEIYDAFIEGKRIPSLLGKIIRFDSNLSTKTDAFAVAQVLCPGDTLFANKLSQFLISIHDNNQMKSFAPANRYYDIVYDIKSGNFTTKADI